MLRPNMCGAISQRLAVGWLARPNREVSATRQAGAWAGQVPGGVQCGQAPELLDQGLQLFCTTSSTT
eukprot:4632765-Prorocentrum_lima.AAC.1